MELDDDSFDILDYLARHGLTPADRFVDVLKLTKKQTMKKIGQLQGRQFVCSADGYRWELTVKGCIYVGTTLSERELDNEYDQHEQE